MGNYANLKAAINAVIKENGQGEITGNVMNQVLMAMVNSLGDGYLFMGVATPSTNPGTPDQNVFYLAGQAGTYSNFGGAVVPNGITVLKFGGTVWSMDNLLTVDAVPTLGSNNPVQSGGVQNELALGTIYDVSAHNSNATFASLNALLSDANLSTLIPTAVRKGGMSIKFVQSSDNKYVQYRYMSSSTANFTNVANWQGVDEEPTAYSNNLVKSDAVFKKDFSLNSDIKAIFADLSDTNDFVEIVRMDNYTISGTKVAAQYQAKLFFFKIKGGYKYQPVITNLSDTAQLAVGKTTDFPALNTSVSDISIKTVNNLNSDYVTNDADCLYLISVGSGYISETYTIEIKIINNENNINLNKLAKVNLTNYDSIAPFTPYKNYTWTTGGAGTNSKLGNYFADAIGKTIYGINLGSVSNKTIKYGVATITNGVVGGFIEKGSLSVVNGIHDYLFLEPIELQENELIYLENCYHTLRAMGSSGNQSFLDGYNGNKIDGTGFAYTYCLILNKENVSTLLSNLNDDDILLQQRVTNLENNTHAVGKYCAVGDSVTEGAYGEGWTPEDVDGLSYADYLSVMIGASAFVKNAIGGFTIYSGLNTLIGYIPNDAKLITVCIGLNDIKLVLREENPIPVGNYVNIIKANAVTDFTDINAYGDNILGHYRWCMEKIKSLFPNATIIAITMPSERFSTQAGQDCWDNIQYGTCAICNLLGIPFIDFIKTSDVFKINVGGQPNWDDFLHDGTHPEKEGYHMMATAIYSLIKGLL